MIEPQRGRGALFAGALAAILVSSCCLRPLVLITLGISGAWIGNLTSLEPFRPIFIGAALVALFLAYRHIFGRDKPVGRMRSVRFRRSAPPTS